MSIEKIDNTGEPHNLDVKRCYLPFIVTAKCPKCGLLVQKHVDNDYLSYPVINKPFDMPMHHVIEHEDDDEEHDWKVKVILRVMLEAAEDPT